MNTHCHTARLLALMVATACTICRADDKPAPTPEKPPTEAELRSAITKSLGFLAKGGNEWMAVKSCNGCHHVPELLWSHREARQRGFSFDQKQFDGWQKWSVENASKKPGPQEAALMILALPERAAPELARLLATEASTNTPEQAESVAQPDPVRLSLNALANPKPATPPAVAASTNASVMLPKKDAPATMESLVFRTLHARSLGKAEEADVLRDEIVNQQRGDGGWSSFVGGNMSDPLATGRVLYALQPSAANPPTTAAIARAQHWLLKTQRDDGSWPIDITHVSKVDRSAPAKAKSVKDATGIFTYWGSGWATIGLLQGVPASVP